MRREVYIPELNLVGVIVSEQLHGAKIRYVLGGFEYEQFMTDEDYMELFEYEGEE